jgi:alkane 1-monooxygenase
MTFVVVPVLDHLIGTDETNPPERAYPDLERDPYYRWAIYLYLPGQYSSLLLACWLWAGGGWVHMTFIDKAGLVYTTGIIGAIGINAAHELGHKHSRKQKLLSKIALSQTMYGHFYVEHNFGHHVHVATPRDSASALLGENLYAFVARSVAGGLRSAWNLEAERLTRHGYSKWSLRNNVLTAWAMTALLYAVLAAWFGPAVIAWLVAQATIGIGILETVNYIEHYGLRRQLRPNGTYERVTAAHSWNSDTLVANVVLYHLQRHSDHHANARRWYQTLRTSDDAPQLPAGYGTMFALALIPPLWRHVMDSRVLAHYNGHAHLTAIAPHHRNRRRRQSPHGYTCSTTAHPPECVRPDAADDPAQRDDSPDH